MVCFQPDLQWNQFWYQLVKKSVDSLNEPWVRRPQSHAAVLEEPAAKT